MTAPTDLTPAELQQQADMAASEGRIDEALKLSQQAQTADGHD